MLTLFKSPYITLLVEANTFTRPYKKVSNWICFYSRELTMRWKWKHHLVTSSPGINVRLRGLPKNMPNISSGFGTMLLNDLIKSNAFWSSSLFFNFIIAYGLSYPQNFKTFFKYIPDGGNRFHRSSGMLPWHCWFSYFPFILELKRYGHKLSYITPQFYNERNPNLHLPI